MTAEVLTFPARAAPVPPAERPRLAVGDMVVCCVNANLSLWCAWPVAVVDDDGVVIGVHNAVGKLFGIDRLNARPDVYGFRAADHEPAAFEALRWKTWSDPGVAVIAFAEIGVARPS